MAARGVGFCNGHLSPTRLNSSQKPSHSALPHSRPCTPACRYTRFAFPSSVPGHNLPAAPHHSYPMPAVLQSPSNRSVLHEPSQRTASAIAPRCIGHRTALRFPRQDTALCPSPHFLAMASALRVWPGSLCPPPDCPIQECFNSQLARSALEPHCIRIGEAPDACRNCGAQAAPQGGTRSRHVG